MSFLAPVFTSIISNPLVQGLVGNLATGALGLLKDTATNVLGSAFDSLTSKKNDLQNRINDYQLPQWSKPKQMRQIMYSEPVRSIKRSYPAIQYDHNDDWEDIEPPRNIRYRSPAPSKRMKSSRVPYNPDLITEYEN